MKKLIILLSLMFSVSANASLISFDFSQTGYDENASVTGSFTGEDLNGDGQLSSFGGEISDFSMSFSGNSLVGAFSASLSDLFGLVYDLNGGPLGDGNTLFVEGIGVDAGVFSYDTGLGPNGSFGGVVYNTTGGSSTTSELVSVTPTSVPEPASIALLGLGLAGLGFSRRKKAA